MRLGKRPVFMIGIASELIGVHPQTLRVYEQKGLLSPRKSIKNTRLYSQEDVELGRYIQRLTQEMGMNLAGVKKVLDLERRIVRLEEENRQLREESRIRELEHARNSRRGAPQLQTRDRPAPARRDCAKRPGPEGTVGWPRPCDATGTRTGRRGSPVRRAGVRSVPSAWLRPTSGSSAPTTPGSRAARGLAL